MHCLLLSNYYAPETVGAGIWVKQLASDLAAAGHGVTVVTSMPNYPAGRIFDAYRGQWWARERDGRMEVLRTATLPTSRKGFWARFASFGAFCLSSMIQPLFVRVRADVVYAILPPLPLGVSGWVLALRTRARLVVNVQDLYPDIAVATGFLKNRWAIQVFRRMERWIYRRAERVVVISEEFRRNLLAKGVPAAKIAVVPNWADPDEIVPMERENSFRQGVGVTRNEFLVLYSGGLTVNSFLEPVIDAARILQDEPFRFVVVGEGAQKAALSERASGLKNVTFLPFQPLERYNEVLAAADVTVVTLNSAATFCSVPSKIFKQMAAARPVLAVTTQTNELTRLVECSQSGFAVNTGKAADVAAALRKARAMGSGLDQLGRNGREYLIRECSRERCVGRIAEILAGAEGASETRH